MSDRKKDDGDWISPATRRGIALPLAVVAGATCALVGAVLVAATLLDDRQAFIDGKALEILQEQLATQPDSRELKEAVRGLDREVRQSYEYRRRLAATGASLLLAAAVVLVAALKLYTYVDAGKPRPAVAKY